MLKNLLLVVIGAYLATSPAYSEKKRQYCTAVVSMARVDYDSSLNLNWFEDSEKQICIFAVIGTAAESNDLATKKAAELIKQYVAGKLNLEAALKAGLVDAVFSSLISPIEDKDLFNENVGTLVGQLKERVSLIADKCFIEGGAFTKIDEIVACGINEEKTGFEITASNSKITFGLRLALI